MARGDILNNKHDIPTPDLDDLTPDSMDNDPLPSHVEVFDLRDESSSESVTPDMDPHILFIKLKEVRRISSRW